MVTNSPSGKMPAWLAAHYTHEGIPLPRTPATISAGICETLRASRRAQYLTLDQVANLVRESTPGARLRSAYLSHIERGHRVPPLATVIAIADVLGMDLVLVPRGEQ